MRLLLLAGSFLAALAPAVAAGAEPQVLRAVVNGRPSDSPGVYTALLGPLEAADAAPAGTPHAKIRLESGTGEAAVLRYYPTLDLLRRPDGWVAVPSGLARRIESDLASVRKESSGPSLSALVSSLVLVLGLGSVAWMTIVRRRRAR